MIKTDVTKIELIWPGKYKEDDTRKGVPQFKLPFQVVESINESRVVQQDNILGKQSLLFDFYEGKEGETFEEGWTNKLIWGDNLLVMTSLLEKFAGKIDLIYIDPPFATGADFSFKIEIGDNEVQLLKQQSIVEEKAYRDTWGKGADSFISMIFERLYLMRDLLSENGSIYVHCDWRVSSYIRLVMDEIFGKGSFLNEIIWFYKTGGASKDKWARKHDTIFVYSKSDKWVFHPQKEKSYMMHKYGFKKSDFKIDEETGLQYSMVYARDVWEIPSVGSETHERVNYPTQKPEALLERIIKASSDEGALVADLFCGSGTTLAVAEKLGRRWIGCDLGRYAIHISRKRMQSIAGCKPFEILNLGKYERQYWQDITFNTEKTMTEQCLYQYLAFILKLYRAQPASDLVHIHGKKDRALVHVGAVDTPVTIDEVNDALSECVSLKQHELHILGWEWEMGLCDLMVAEAKNQGVKLVLLQIPREVMEWQAAEKSDVRFFELAYLEIDIKNTKKTTFIVTLKDFVIPNTELIPDEVRSKIRKWSDYIDYWAIDWNFQNDTFMQSWVTYRTRKDRTLLLTSDPYTYKQSGIYQILIKVIDIFGNDTSQAFEIKVS